MTKSQKVIVTTAADGKVSAATKDAELLDVVTTAISTDSAVTGAYGLMQKAALVAGGMAIQSKLKNDTFNFLK